MKYVTTNLPQKELKDIFIYQYYYYSKHFPHYPEWNEAWGECFTSFR